MGGKFSWKFPFKHIEVFIRRQIFSRTMHIFSSKNILPSKKKGTKNKQKEKTVTAAALRKMEDNVRKVDKLMDKNVEFDSSSSTSEEEGKGQGESSSETGFSESEDEIRKKGRGRKSDRSKEKCSGKTKKKHHSGKS